MASLAVLRSFSNIAIWSRLATVVAIAPLAVSVVFACRRSPAVEEPPFEETTSSTIEMRAAHLEDPSGPNRSTLPVAGVNPDAGAPPSASKDEVSAGGIDAGNKRELTPKVRTQNKR